jgi:AcrR family transcriptional regulator
MNVVLKNLKPEIYEGIFLKDPERSELGRKILKEGIYLIDKIGFEAFTFKKLGERIQSNESSIYRYFENKHKLLIYLSSWYWNWIEFRLVFETANLEDANYRLTKAIILLTEDTSSELLEGNIKESTLKKIIAFNFIKTFNICEINNENFIKSYKQVILLISEIIKEVNPTYLYPENLSIIIVEGTLHQHFLRQNFRAITNYSESISPTDFFLNMVKAILNTSERNS